RLLALKSLGLSLRQIQLIQSEPAKAPAGFAEQRRALEEKAGRIGRAIGAPDSIEQADSPDTALQRFGGELIWNPAEEARRTHPSPIVRAPDRVAPSKLELFQDIQAQLDREVDEEAARSLVARWDAMVLQETDGDPDAIAKIRKMWARWPTLP